MANSHSVPTSLDSLTKVNNEADARQVLRRIIEEAVMHGFLSEDAKGSAEEKDENQIILNQLKSIHENTKSSRPHFELAFHLAISNIDFSASIIEISNALKSNLEAITVMEAERTTHLNLIKFIREFAIPAKLIAADRIPKSDHQEIISALKIIKSSAAEIKHTSTTIPSIINDIFSKINLNAPGALDTANSQLQPLTLKKVNEIIAVQAIQHTLIKYSPLFKQKQSLILWNPADVEIYFKIQEVLSNPNLSAEKKLSAINTKLIPIVKQFTDENGVIDSTKLQEAELSTIKILAAIYFSLETMPCQAIEEKIRSMLDPEDIEQFLTIEDTSPRIVM